jgi:flagellar FliJ protein
MSTLRALALAIDLATEKRDEAGRQLMQAQRTYQFALNQLGQLESYAADSEARWLSAAQVSVDTGVLQHHYQFMDRLRHAIGLQDGVLADQQRQMEAARQRVQEAEARLTGLKKVLARKQMEQLKAQARREQKQMDEFAAMQHARSMARLQSGEQL